MRLEPGSRLGPYEILGPVGAGGMGEVYRARDTRLGREVAVKVLPADLLRDADRLARFEREARTASALNHRNIVTIHDFSSREGEAWLVMELIRGESLRTLLSRGPIPMKTLLSIATAVAGGLAAAHAAGIVHRDLKPENIMIATDGTPKILDFGLVKSAVAPNLTDSPTELRVTRSGMVLGTASYMSPEQARGEEVDFRTDHFSFGLIVHEMITGRHPFARPSPIETLAAIMSEEPDRLPENVPEPLVWIVDRCLARDRNQRY
jgi:serine/threonine protein kinase